ncbi:MAG TPA: molecular chaperone DnaJ [Micromonosporaceae bacterium]|nr:molecular chaperone DnaJ [Micromonosporaceae bacterium]
MTAPALPATFADAVALLGTARTPADVFGDDTHVGLHIYRQLAKILHPDRAPADRADTATAAFARLTALWAARHGDPVTVDSRKRSYTLGPLVAAGDLADLYDVEVDGSPALFKIARSPVNNDLVEREAVALRRLHAEGDERHRAYVPELHDAFTLREAGTGVRRVITVTSRATGFVSLAEVRDAYPAGLDPRDAAWMWRRLLVALGFAHRAGVVHGAVLPDHVLIHPAAHGLALVDWCYSGGDGDPVPAIVSRYRDWYPPEVLSRKAPGPGTDIHLASRCVAALMGRAAPAPLTRFIRGCTLTSVAARPDDAWQVLRDLDALLERLYGPRTFRPFAMPST